MSLSTSRAHMPTHNQRVVLNLVRTEGPISRADIVRLSGLTFPSVSRIVGELIERGLVAEKRQRRGGMGKPPTELEMSPRSAFSVGDRIAMLHEGRIRQVGTRAEIQATDDPVVRQFIEGRPGELAPAAGRSPA